jgi:hypothetical protein
MRFFCLLLFVATYPLTLICFLLLLLQLFWFAEPHIHVHASFNCAVPWDTRLEELSNHADPATVIGIIGNKSDLDAQRRVSIEEGTEFAKANRLLFFETSAKDAQNVDEGVRCVLSNDK